MAVPANKEEFKNYCLRKLGDPAVTVNVTPEQIDDRVDEALEVFRERHNEAVEEIYIYHDITAPEKIVDSNGNDVLDSNGDPILTTNTDVEKGYIKLPNDILAVIDVFRPRNSIGVTGIEYQHYINEISRMLSPNRLSNGMSYFYMFDSHMTLINRFFNPTKSYNYNKYTNKLIIAGGVAVSDREYGGVMIRALRKLDGDANDSMTGEEIHNIWQSRWLQNYTTMLIKEQWGTNLGKYQQVQLLGGITMNGDQILQDAREQLQLLKEELETSYELPPLPFWG